MSAAARHARIGRISSGFPQSLSPVTFSASLVAQPVTLDQLVALSDEIAALARAGVPLDRGLRDLARDMPGRLGRIADDMGQRLAAGKPLEQVVAELGPSLPPAYRTVISAGMRAGRLPAALEDVARTARRISQLRSSIGLSLLYPLILLLIAWQMLLFVLTKLTPVMMVAMQEVGLPVEPWETISERIAWAAPWLWWLVPLLIVTWAVWTWYRSGRVVRGVELHPALSLGAVGMLALIQRAGRVASLADVLALLVAHETPLPEAVELASGAVGSAKIERGGRELAERLRRGETIAEVPKGFPPLIAWALSGGQSAGGQAPGQLARTLRRMAEVHRDEVARRSHWLALYAPLVLTLGVGGTAVAIYAAITLLPWILILYRLSEPVF
jgi:general secretion pathway protein F